MARIVDGGGGDPSSTYDYSHIPSPDLEELLKTPVVPIQALVQSWQNFASNMDSIVNHQAMSLTAASQLLSGWSGRSATEFTKRLQQVIDLGTQIKSAAITTGESFAQPGQSFHVATNSLTYSMKDMNTWGTDVINAQSVWCSDISTIIENLVNRTPGFIGDTVPQDRYYVTPYKGPFNKMLNEPQPCYTFEYVYGENVPGVVIFNGDVRGPSGATVISTTNGVYPDEKQTFTWGDPGTTPSPDDIRRLFPHAYQNQLQLMLSQVGGSMYHPQVGKFPPAPKPAWSGSSSQQTGGPSGGPGSFGGLGGSGGLNGLGGGVGGLGNGGTPNGGFGGGGTGSGGSPGGGFGTGGSGSGGPPGGGAGGFGSGGSPGGGSGGFGSGGSPGGGPTKIAGAGPGGPGGGLGPFGGGGFGGGGTGGLGNLAGAGSGSGGLTGTDALSSAVDGAAGTPGATGSAVPMMPPMMPPMAGAAGQNDNTRQRKSWLPDDEEIWGDDSAAVPPVISSDG